jgi:hypothetical protein
MHQGEANARGGAFSVRGQAKSMSTDVIPWIGMVRSVGTTIRSITFDIVYAWSLRAPFEFAAYAAY